MKKGIKYLFNLLMVTALLVSTTGVTIYTHYCNSEGQVTSSLFVDEAICNHQTPTEHQHDCCQTKASCTTENSPGCCSDVKQHYKIDNTYYTSDSESDSPEPVVLQLIDVLVFGFTPESMLPIKRTVFFQEPPPVSGKELITRILQIKISPVPFA